MPSGTPSSPTSFGSELLFSAKNKLTSESGLVGSTGSPYFPTDIIPIEKFNGVRAEVQVLDGQVGVGTINLSMAESYDGINLINHYLVTALTTTNPRSNFFQVSSVSSVNSYQNAGGATQTFGPNWTGRNLGINIVKVQPMPPFIQFIISTTGILWDLDTHFDIDILGLRL